jgi:hypothetical protein
MDTSKAISYTIIFVIGLLIFIGLIFVGITLPSKNDSDELTGYILSVNNLKYVKLFSLIFSYIILLVLVFFSYSVSYSYLDLGFLTTLFYDWFIFMAFGSFIFFPVMVYFIVANWIKDVKIGEYLSRGLRVK